jgi:FkbM family methyltransferase
MNAIGKIAGDFLGICRVLGFGYALRWMIAIAVHFREVLAERNLQPADRAMGVGPFHLTMRRYGAEFKITGAGAFSGIREMYVRDTYLRAGMLRIDDGDVVVDLGANMGNFTNLALAHGNGVRVVAVEPNSELIGAFWQSISTNVGFKERASLVRTFLGFHGEKQAQMDAMPECKGASMLTEAEFIKLAAIERVDFLKCDIEGGEFGLLGPKSALLRMTRKLAVEVHSFAGDVRGFIDMLGDQGFEVRNVQQDPDGTATVLASRR